MSNTNEIANVNKDISLSIKEERSKLPIIPPIFTITPFNAFAVHLNSGTQTSEYMAYMFPTHKLVKKNPKNPIVMKKIQEKTISKVVAIKEGIK